MSKKRKPEAVDPLGFEPSDGLDNAANDLQSFAGVDLSFLNGPIDLEQADDADEPVIEERVKASRKIVDETIAARRAKEQAVRDRLDMGFFFSVVFATRKERDEWLRAHGIKLRAEDYVIAQDLDAILK